MKSNIETSENAQSIKSKYVVSAKGAHLTFAGGKIVLDGCSGAVCANIGHGRSEVADVAHSAIVDNSYSHTNYTNKYRLELREKLFQKWFSNDFDGCLFLSGGGEAIEAAIKAALHFHKISGQLDRGLVLSREVAYHGSTYMAYSLSSQECFDQEMRSYLYQPTRIPVYDHCGQNFDPSQFEKIVKKIGQHRIAAFVAEPISGSSGGVLIPPVGYWEEIYKICKQSNIILIFDEVMTGFGRVGRRFAYKMWDMAPDILVAGKGLGCGYAPICGLYTSPSVTKALVEASKYIMTSTYSAHNTSCAVAAKVLDILESEDLVRKSLITGTYLINSLSFSLKKHDDVIREIRGAGLFCAIEFQDNNNNQSIDVNNVLQTCFEGGVDLYPGGKGTSHPAIIVAPPFTAENRHIDKIVNTIDSAITHLKNERMGQNGKQYPSSQS